MQNSDLITEKLAGDIKQTMAEKTPGPQVVTVEEVEEGGLSRQSTVKGEEKQIDQFYAGYKAQLAQLIKFVFFENRQAQGIPLANLMQDLAALEQ